MPQNKRESIIYSIIVCFLMVFVMSIYNVTLHHGELTLAVVKAAWLGFPIGFIFALFFDLVIVSKIAKGFAFRYLIKSHDKPLKIAICISSCMVVCMVLIMSFYRALEACVTMGQFNALPIIWLSNIPKNFIMALPLQLMIVGPVSRKVFRSLFPLGTVK